MKTTIDITDSLLLEAKAVAQKNGTTLRALIEQGLREVLSRRKRKRTRFRLRDASFNGNGLQPGVDLGDWNLVSPILYEGRGG